MQSVGQVLMPLRALEPSFDTVSLRIALLPQSASSSIPLLIDQRQSHVDDVTIPPVQLLEGQEYLYEWIGLPSFTGDLIVDPAEVFQRDLASGIRGRLRTGLFTGALNVALRLDGRLIGELDLEVRSRKLQYASEYRWMLKDIADHMNELVMNRFAVSNTSFNVDATRDAVTLYQRFAFLRALLKDEQFQLALAEITRRPHVAWQRQHRRVRAGAAIKADAYTVRQLTRPGPRTNWPGGAIASLPTHLDRRHTETTHDTTPNKFVKFAITRWRQVVADIDAALQMVAEDSAVARGRREIADVLALLDEALHHELFLGLGPLARFPGDDQVLQRREGYRDVFRAYVEFELAARLSWRQTDNQYWAGQRDVATLYEYWVFIQLATLVADLIGQTFDLTPLIETRADGLNVTLQAGREMVLTGVVERLGRTLEVELCFNRTFGPRSDGTRSWTRPMRPDYSLILKSGNVADGFEPVILHFDAKYRVAFVKELFGDSEELSNTDAHTAAGGTLTRGGAVRADLLKMHAYRDAIHRSAGAYVLYPGDEDEWDQRRFTEYHELLPGLGAFVLRPTQHGVAIGTGALRVFLDDVFDHVATRLTEHERARYWSNEVYGGADRADGRPRQVADSEPSPDTTILLGYAKSREHWNWILRRRTYNVRAEGRPGGIPSSASMLYSQLLVVYCPELESVKVARIVAGPEIVSKSAIAATGYPDAQSDYLCVQISWMQAPWTAGLTAVVLDGYVSRQGLRGAPRSVRWEKLRTLRLP